MTQGLEHPKNPNQAYAFAFEDHLAKISTTRDNLANFLGSLVDDSVLSKLTLQIDAIGTFNGRTEFDIGEREDYYYDDPRPFRTGAFETHPSLDIPFEQKPGVVTPEEDDNLEAHYLLWPSKRSSVKLSHNSEGANGQGLTLWGGHIMLKGNLEIPDSPELTSQIVEGYISPRQSEIGLWAPDGEDMISAGSIITVERVYRPQAVFLSRPYNPMSVTLTR